MKSRLDFSSSVVLAVALGGLWSLPARADGITITGRWWTPLGVMKISQKGKKVTGTVSWKCKVCPFKRGEKVFRGVLLEDSLSGRMRYCLKGKQCKGDGWAPLVMRWLEIAPTVGSFTIIPLPVVFFLSMILRLCALPMLRFIREPRHAFAKRQ